MKTTKDILIESIKDNPVQVQESFNELMKDKIASLLEQKKIEVASTMFTENVDGDEDDDEDEEESEDDDSTEEDPEEGLEDEELEESADWKSRQSKNDIATLHRDFGGSIEKLESQIKRHGKLGSQGHWSYNKPAHARLLQMHHRLTKPGEPMPDHSGITDFLKTYPKKG